MQDEVKPMSKEETLTELLRDQVGRLHEQRHKLENELLEATLKHEHAEHSLEALQHTMQNPLWGLVNFWRSRTAEAQNEIRKLREQLSAQSRGHSKHTNRMKLKQRRVDLTIDYLRAVVARVQRKAKLAKENGNWIPALEDIIRVSGVVLDDTVRVTDSQKEAGKKVAAAATETQAMATEAIDQPAAPVATKEAASNG